MPGGRRWGRTLGGALALAAIALLLALGVWQLERLRWKRTLIAQVERRLAATPVAAPGPRAWAAIGSADAYTRVRITGRYMTGRDSIAQAVTELGPGYWVMTPLQAAAGIVLMNRGFIPAGLRDHVPAPPAGIVTVTGLLRPSEPGGSLLRANQPAADRWFSRDIAAIAARRGIGPAAPYFIDADRAGDGWPRGGMTKVRFPNNHLVYALTWFALAGLVGWMTLRAMRVSRV